MASGEILELRATTVPTLLPLLPGCVSRCPRGAPGGGAHLLPSLRGEGEKAELVNAVGVEWEPGACEFPVCL